MKYKQAVVSSSWAVFVVLLTWFILPTGEASAQVAWVTTCSSADTIIQGSPVTVSYCGNCGCGTGTYYPSSSQSWCYTCAGGDQLGGWNSRSSGVDVTVIPLSCGGSNGGSFPEAPTSGLCTVGSPSGVSRPTYGPYTWSCSNGNASIGCSASVRAPSCGSPAPNYVAPSSGLCSVGTPSGVSNNDPAGPFTWNCATNAGAWVTGCSSLRKIDAQCGTAESYKHSYSTLEGGGVPCKGGYNSLSYVPSSSTPSALPLADYRWTWTCSGLNGGTNASCSALRIANGVCQSPPNGGVNFTVSIRPTAPLCVVFDPLRPSSVSQVFTYRAPTDLPPVDYTWTCFGVNGGSDATCNASCTNQCEASKPAHCQSEMSWKIKNDCSTPVAGRTVDCTGPGTRACNLNFREVPPSSN